MDSNRWPSMEDSMLLLVVCVLDKLYLYLQSNIKIIMNNFIQEAVAII